MPPDQSPWPPPTDDYQLLELELEWSDLDAAQARIAAALRPFVLTRDPLNWIPERGCAWATANADGDTLEVVVYVLREDVQRRLDDADGGLGAAVLPYLEPVVLAGSTCADLLVSGAYADLAFRGQTPPLLREPAPATTLPAPVARLRTPHWEPVGLGAVQDLVQEAFGPVALDRSAVRLEPAETPQAGCLACAGSSFGFPGDLETAMHTMCPAHGAEAQAITSERIEHAHRSNAAGWRALGKGSARATGLTDPVDTPMPERHRRAVGRNDPCPCGSGRKYKQCCGR
jgi:SEC-C motif